MKVLHITNGLDANGRFGGVQIVVLGLAKAQQLHGDTVVVVSGRTRSITDPSEIEGTRLISAPLRTPFPALGAGAQLAPLLMVRAIRAIAQAEVVHVHFSRDVTSLSAVAVARLLRRPIVLQTHGMLDAPGNALARLLDRVAVPAALDAAGAVLVLGEEEHRYVTALRPDAPVLEFPNGTAAVEEVVPLADRDPCVLFLARLHPRKRATEFARAAITAIRASPAARDHRFVVAGPDEGDAGAVRAVVARSGLADRFDLPGGMPHARALEALGRCRLFVLTAPGEPFGMTVVEAMMRGTPVVLHETAELAPVVAEHGLGWTFRDEADLAVLLARIPQDVPELARRGDAARAYAAEHYGVDRVVERLLAVYRRARAGSGVRPGSSDVVPEPLGDPAARLR